MRSWKPGGLVLLLTAMLVAGGCCGSFYFRPAAEPPPVLRFELAAWPYDEYWTGIVFNGAKVGFTHLQIRPAASGSARFEIASEAALHMRFLTVDKRVLLRSRDLVASDLGLVEFNYSYDLDGSVLEVVGRVTGRRVETRVVSGGKASRLDLAAAERVYPTSAIPLYPLLHGLELGRTYEYLAFDGETQSLVRVSQEVLDYQESDLFKGKAFKVRTRVHGHESTMWIGVDGKPQLEISMHGVLISGLETEEVARSYLVRAALNKSEVLLDFSLVRPEGEVGDPDRLARLEVLLKGIDRQLVADDRWQQCRMEAGGLRCRITRAETAARYVKATPQECGGTRYLLASRTVPSDDPEIVGIAREAAAGAQSSEDKIMGILRWLRANIGRRAVDAFSAKDVLAKGEGECQGHAYLYAAMARALGIPTRVVNGLAYSVKLKAFGYHTWAESCVGTAWVPVDPIQGEFPADVSHIKLIEGENILDLLPLAAWVGRLRLRVVDDQ